MLTQALVLVEPKELNPKILIQENPPPDREPRGVCFAYLTHTKEGHQSPDTMGAKVKEETEQLPCTNPSVRKLLERSDTLAP